MIFEESDEHTFPLAIVLKICSLFIYCPQSSCYTMILKSTLLYNKTLWIIQEKKNMYGWSPSQTHFSLCPVTCQRSLEQWARLTLLSLKHGLTCLYYICSYIQLLFKYGVSLFWVELMPQHLQCLRVPPWQNWEF